MRQRLMRVVPGIAILGTLATTAVSAQSNPPRADDPGGAAKYFEEIRAFPAATIPPGARMAALAEMRARWPRLVAQRDALLTSVPNGLTTTWSPLGPAPETGQFGAASGRLNSIAIDPTNGSRIFVGGAQGGVWRTLDGGATWTPLTDSQCSLAMGSIAIDPSNLQVIYAGTGELNNSADSYYGCGVLKSTDGGTTWTQLGASVFVRIGARSATISKIIVDRTQPSNVLVASSFGLYRSIDGGANWALAQDVSGFGFVASDVIQDPTTPTVFFAAVGSISGTTANGIFKSVDGGATWTKLTGTAPNALPTTNVGRINLAASPAGGITTLVAAIEHANNSSQSDGQLLGMFVTTDGGATWATKSASFASNGTMCSAQCWYSMALAVDPTNASLIYFGGLSLYRSSDGGVTFTDVGQPMHVDQHAIAFDPSDPTIIYAGNDGGIFKSTNASVATTIAAAWTSLNTNLSLTQFYAGVSVSPISATTILGGTQDNGTLQWSGTPNWSTVITGDGGYTAIDQVTGGVMWGETQWTSGSTFSGPRRKDASGSNFFQKLAGISTADKAAFIPPLVMDPVRPRILYFGTQNLYRTANSGDLWTLVGASLVASTGVINAIGVAPSDSLTVYVGSNDARVSYTHDGGLTWIVATGLPTAAVTDIAVDARDARTAVVVFGGFSGSHVWKTTDGGATWADLTNNLVNIPTLAVVLEPGSQDVDIGTDLGVFTLRNGTTSWSPVLNGLPNVAVYDLVFDTQRSRLIAGTHGRGMFSLDVTPAPALRGDINANGAVEVVDAQAILAAVVGLPIPAGSIRYPNGDANCDGQVTAVDALLVLMKVAGSNTGTACVGTKK